jgi:hypothetical protein
LFPEPARDLDRLDAGGLPPSALITDAMNRAVMHAAERHRELIAYFYAQRARLRKVQVMRVTWVTATDDAGLRSNKAKVRLVAAALWFREEAGCSRVHGGQADQAISN